MNPRNFTVPSGPIGWTRNGQACSRQRGQDGYITESIYQLPIVQACQVGPHGGIMSYTLDRIRNEMLTERTQKAVVLTIKVGCGSSEVMQCEAF